MPGNVRSKKAKNSELLAQRKEALFSKTLGIVANEVSVSYTGTSKAMVAAAWRRHGEIIAVKVEFFTQ